MSNQEKRAEKRGNDLVNHVSQNIIANSKRDHFSLAA
jgi:hypothetical protein